MIKVRQFAFDICELFEDVLDRNDITIPDEDDDQREPDNTARLYGMTYAELEDSVVDILYMFADEIIRNYNAELVDEY